MTSVKEIIVNFLGDDVIYGPNPGQSTATKEMKIKWKRMASTVENLLVDFGINPENANIERHDSFMIVALEGELAFEEAMVLLYVFEEIFKVTEFSYNAEYDEYTETDPRVHFGIYEKEE